LDNGRSGLVRPKVLFDPLLKGTPNDKNTLPWPKVLSISREIELRRVVFKRKDRERGSWDRI
jgi:hypothetical protein